MGNEPILADDLFDICVILNQVKHVRLGASLLPYAERIKAIVVDAVEPQLHRSIMEWQRATFPGGTPEGAWAHLLEELEELAEAIREHDLAHVREEVADVYLLAVAVSHLSGFDLLDAVNVKMAENRKRQWENTAGAKGYRKHVEGGAG